MQLNTLASFFDKNYMPHGHCYLWQPHILWTNVISDFLIAVAYFSLPIAIMLFSVKRKDIGYNQIFLLFSLFILFCGITHVFSIFTIWHGVYGYHALSKAITAIVSVATAIIVYRLLPQAVTLPTISQFNDVKGQLDIAVQSKSELQEKVKDHQLVHFILNSIPLSTLLIDHEGNSVFTNQRFESEFGEINPDYVGQDSLNELMTLTDADQIKLTNFFEFSTSHTPQLKLDAEMKKTKDQLEVTIEKSIFEGNLVVIVTFNNVSEINKIQSELEQSHSRLERAISATEDGIWEWNVQENSVNYSPQLMKIIGKSSIKEPKFDDWFSHIHPDHANIVSNAIQTHFDTKKKYSVEYLGSDQYGNYSWFVAVGDSIFDDEDTPLVMSGSLRNIEPTKQLELLNKENKDFINVIYEGSSHAIWVLNTVQEDTFLFEQYNKAACKWSQTTEDKVVGKHLLELSDIVFPKDVVQKLRANYQQCVNSKTKKDYIESIQIDDTTSWYKTTLYPILNNHGDVIKIVGTAIDVTNEQNLLVELKDSNEYLERFAFVASHDLQEPLRKITAFSGLLSQRLNKHLSSDKEAQYEFSRITNAAERMSIMINDILKLSRINTSTLKINQCSVETIIREVSEILSSKIESTKTSIKVLNGDIFFSADKGLIVLLFQNLIVNAIKFSRPSVVPEINISVEDSKNRLIIFLRDNGIGIEKEFYTQIFEPFRRLHSIQDFEGSGIGLALCRQITKVHGGSIECIDNELPGACFKISLNKSRNKNA